MEEMCACVDSVHYKVLTIWEDVFNLTNITTNADFYTFGGNSILAAQLIHRLNKSFQLKLTPAWLAQHHTIVQQAHDIRENSSLGYRPIIVFNDRGSSNFYMIHPGLIGAECYSELARLLDRKINFFGIDSYNLYNEPMLQDLKQLAKLYAQSIADHTTSAQIFLGGWSLGGVIAYEICNQLRQYNITVTKLILIEPDAPQYFNMLANNDITAHAAALQNSPDYILAYLHTLPQEIVDKILRNLSFDITMSANYRPDNIVDTHAIIFEAKFWNHESLLGKKISLATWSNYISNLEIIECDSDHLSIMNSDNLPKIAAVINKTIVDYQNAHS